MLPLKTKQTLFPFDKPCNITLFLLTFFLAMVCMIFIVVFSAIGMRRVLSR